MDHFPPEIWEQIFIFACTDSGRTGRYLSIVSRYFRNVSRSYQYQSVSLTRSKHIPSFRRTLFHAPLEARRIRYLYVCCPNVFLDVSDDEDPDYVEIPMTISSRNASNEIMEVESDSSGEEYEGSPTSEELQEALDDSIALKSSEDPFFLPQGCNDNDADLRVWDDFDEDVQAADVFILEALRDILCAASLSLLILSVNWTSFRPFLLEEILVPLPNLVELHLCRTFTSQDEIDPETEETAPTLFPRLQRLHIFGYVDQRPDSFGQSLGRIAPSLTQIRMPNYYIRYALVFQLMRRLNRDAQTPCLRIIPFSRHHTEGCT